MNRGPERTSVRTHLRSDNGSAPCAKVVRRRLHRLSLRTLLLEPQTLWENGHSDFFTGSAWTNGWIKRFPTLRVRQKLIDSYHGRSLHWPLEPD